MALIFTPDTGTMNEPELATITPITVTCTDDTTTVDPTTGATSTNSNPIGIVSATTTDPGLTVSVSNNTFTVSGQILGAFSRTLKYLDNNLVPQVATSFATLPTGIGSLTQYTAPSAQTADVIISITFADNSTAQYVIIAHFNYTTSNAALQTITQLRDKF